MENHSHCKECGNLVRPHVEYCPKCKVKDRKHKQHPKLSEIEQVIEDWMRNYEKRKESQKK